LPLASCILERLKAGNFQIQFLIGDHFADVDVYREGDAVGFVVGDIEAGRVLGFGVVDNGEQLVN
jgi:hypothetical protein